jgi:hypothetical protein
VSTNVVVVIGYVPGALELSRLFWRAVALMG